MYLPDGPGWSPDGGKYWVNDNRVYWHNGVMLDLREGGVFRIMPGGYEHSENYYLLHKKENVKITLKGKEIIGKGSFSLHTYESDEMCKRRYEPNTGEEDE